MRLLVGYSAPESPGITRRGPAVARWSAARVAAATVRWSLRPRLTLPGLPTFSPSPCFEIPHPNAQVVDLEYLDGVQPDRIRPVGGAGAEHAGEWLVLIAAWMHREHVAPRSVEPGQHDELAADRDVRDALSGREAEDQPGVRRALVTLSGREVAVHERGFHMADGMHLEHRLVRATPLW
jgi:hypothetical protein